MRDSIISLQSPRYKRRENTKKKRKTITHRDEAHQTSTSLDFKPFLFNFTCEHPNSYGINSTSSLRCKIERIEILSLNLHPNSCLGALYQIVVREPPLMRFRERRFGCSKMCQCLALSIPNSKCSYPLLPVSRLFYSIPEAYGRKPACWSIHMICNNAGSLPWR